MQDIVFYAVIFLAVSALLMRLPVHVLKKGWIPISMLLGFTFASNIFFTHGKILLSLGSIIITDEGLALAAIRTSRIFFMVAGSKILNASLSLDDMVSALTSLFKSFARIGLPVNDFVSTMALTLKCFPALEQHVAQSYKEFKNKTHDAGFFRIAQIVTEFLLPMFMNSMKSPEQFFRRTDGNT